MMKRILFTGGRGFIGKNFINAYGSYFEINAPNRAELELSNTNAVDTYFSTSNFDYIVHSANVGGTRKNQRPVLTCLNENLRAFANLFKHRDKVERFIQLGSGAEYGRPLSHMKISEDELEKSIPQDEYGLSKLLCSRWINNEPPHKAVTLHLFGVFGPYEDYQMRFISNAIVRTLAGLPIIINQDVVFDYLFVKDCINIIYQFITKPAKFSNYNLGSGQAIKLSEIAIIIRDVLGTQNEIIIKNPGLGHEYTCDNQRLLEFLGNDFRFTPLSQSIKELAHWYESQFDHLNHDWIINPC